VFRSGVGMDASIVRARSLGSRCTYSEDEA
jgi:hypothetical protein